MSEGGGEDPSPAAGAPMITLFDRKRHLAYFSFCLRQLPVQYEKLDTNRLTMAHFCVHALDLLGVWDDETMIQDLKFDKSTIIEWIYSLQTTTLEAKDPSFVGFKGGTFLGHPSPTEYNHGHIAMTYTAIATLKTLGDDLSRVDRRGIVNALGSALQLADGSYQSIAVGSEHDMRFLYCACAISHMLDDWSGVDCDKAVSYIRACRSWDGAFALLPGQEGHGGSTFCAVASLMLMGRMEEVLDSSSHHNWRKDLIRWCVHRQVGGMQGRPNKDEDTCYSFWIGGTLRLLGKDALLDHDRLRAYVMECQTKMGGFSKTIGAYPDVLHSFYSLSYLSFSQAHFIDKQGGDPWKVQIRELNCTLGIAKDRAALFGNLFP